MIIKWPNAVEPNSKCDVPVISTDFYPTMLQMAGLPSKPKQHVDGMSLVPLLKGGDLDRGALYWHYPHYGNQGNTPGSAIRAGDYKLIHFFEDDRLELYNLRDDISEEHNLAVEMPDMTDRLNQKLIAWREQVAVQFPQSNPHFPNSESDLG